MKSKSVTRKYLILASFTAWILLILFSIIIFWFYPSQTIDIWKLPLKSVVAFIGGGGLACFLLAWTLKVGQERGNSSQRHGVSKRVSNRRQKLIWRTAQVVFVFLNVFAFIFAYSLTHFRTPGQFGIGIPRPLNSRLPRDIGLEYVTHRIALDRSEWLESWLIPAQPAVSKGTVDVLYL